MVTGGPALAGSGRWSADPAAHLATHPWLPRSGSTSMWLAGHPYGEGEVASPLSAGREAGGWRWSRDFARGQHRWLLQGQDPVPLSPCPQGSAPPLGWTGWLLMAPSSRGSSPGLFVAGPGRGWLWAWVIVSRPVPFLLRGSEVGDWAVGGAWVPSSDLGLGLS